MIDKDNSLAHKTTTWKYDAVSFVKEIVDPSGDSTTFERDELGRMTKKTEPIDGTATMVAQWTYNAWGAVSKLTDDNGSDTDYAYDALYRLTTKTYEDTKTVGFTYDDNNNVTQIIDQNGTDIDQTFDVLNRLTDRDVTRATGVGGDDTEDFKYDAVGRLTEAKDDDSIVQLTYDSLSRVLTEKQGPNPFGTAAKTVSYTYDAAIYRVGHRS